MRWFSSAIVIAACIAGAALAQDDQGPTTDSAQAAEAISPEQSAPAFTPQWEDRSARLARMYPTRALERGMAGIVHLCCTARADRRLDCNVAIEWPENQSFGSTALRYANGLRLTESSYAELLTQQNQTIHFPFRWHTEPAPEELDGIARQVRAQAVDICGPGTGEPPEYIVISARRL